MKNTKPSTLAPKNTNYCLVHRITRKPIFSDPPMFRSMSAAIMYGLQHDLHVDIVPATRDLFGKEVPE